MSSALSTIFLMRKAVKTSPDITGLAEPNFSNAVYAGAGVLSKAVR